eukprot:scaffold121323_cov32-Attheya_sp.AAC.3
MKLEDADKPQKTSQSNPKSIHFIPQTLTENAKFSNLLIRELLLRELPAMGDITLRRERLRDTLRRERFMRRLQKQSEHGTVEDSALFLVMQSIPCILHCSNRVNLKILTMLLMDGLSYAKKGKIISEFKDVSTNFYWTRKELSIPL